MRAIVIFITHIHKIYLYKNTFMTWVPRQYRCVPFHAYARIYL